ncbi:MAG: hypothetical protein AVDCRST_MAG93-699 [uncultured Chloroflexia bacterium]|uniref:Uncharacterized protein n=1 Tax=uncultured Chloroflexia bacterium TaxID=1672391 RepID=A0A6J4HMR6_9CHLR|nr:MAG: hypothetical protein AVDCRST_MAG93-699 [uncultured Chloroflexia bacterium]
MAGDLVGVDEIQVKEANFLHALHPFTADNWRPYTDLFVPYSWTAIPHLWVYS